MRWWWAALVAGLVTLLTACGPLAPAPPGASAGDGTVLPTDAMDTTGATDAAEALAGLVVTARPRPPADYDRNAFGARWADVDGNGCNQRDDVLLRDAEPGTARIARQGRCDHDVLAGTWTDPYTGRTLTFDDLKDPAQAQAIQIDHVVPLAEAWVSGASAWDDARRREYANDLAGLLAVDGPTNAAKGADDPAAWRPRKAYQCAYARRWIEVKARWRLTVDPSEVAALDDMLGYCS
ncbi:HNH endonuclease family protein [Nocardioides humi]|uniref:GmrSD restriction endonucleases C-terminal domain-containing protein n=1 Tax=Nocardioides humi TaxID=449461 RepID=A0ABN2AXW7_9ACTN|nr:HNH endonuclease family protein [Nocardioides humi]